jgi:hypothetical protein
MIRIPLIHLARGTSFKFYEIKKEMLVSLISPLEPINSNTSFYFTHVQQQHQLARPAKGISNFSILTCARAHIFLNDFSSSSPHIIEKTTGIHVVVGDERRIV